MFSKYKLFLFSLLIFSLAFSYAKGKIPKFELKDETGKIISRDD